MLLRYTDAPFFSLSSWLLNVWSGTVSGNKHDRRARADGSTKSKGGDRRISRWEWEASASCFQTHGISSITATDTVPPLGIAANENNSLVCDPIDLDSKSRYSKHTNSGPRQKAEGGKRQYESLYNIYDIALRGSLLPATSLRPPNWQPYHVNRQTYLNQVAAVFPFSGEFDI